MSRDRRRASCVCTHLVQYFAPILQRMAKHPNSHIQVAHCMYEPQAGMDPQFGIDAQEFPAMDCVAWPARQTCGRRG